MNHAARLLNLNNILTSTLFKLITMYTIIDNFLHKIISYGQIQLKI